MGRKDIGNELIFWRRSLYKCFGSIISMNCRDRVCLVIRARKKTIPRNFVSISSALASGASRNVSHCLYSERKILYQFDESAGQGWNLYRVFHVGILYF